VAYVTLSSVLMHSLQAFAVAFEGCCQQLALPYLIDIRRPPVLLFADVYVSTTELRMEYLNSIPSVYSVMNLLPHTASCITLYVHFHCLTSLSLVVLPRRFFLDPFSLFLETVEKNRPSVAYTAQRGLRTSCPTLLTSNQSLVYLQCKVYY
jgi:hypothetical protein